MKPVPIVEDYIEPNVRITPSDNTDKEVQTTTTIIIPISVVKSCRDELNELKGLTGIDKSRKRLQISKSNKCTGSDRKELQSL